jgi:uroporphyrinogen decarboxylase
MMRQAGRCLPEYRALKEKYSFLELVKTPDLATEVTLQPVRRFGFDAAILFSDILVIPEAMGQGYHFRETGGVQMEFTVRNARDIARLSPDAVEERLDYVMQALGLLKKELAGRTALLGFSGAPWTLANFMLDGGSAKQHTQALRLLRSNRKLLDALLEKLTGAVITYLKAQIAAGTDAVQIFDTHAGLLADDVFAAASGQWIQRIVEAIDGQVPVIVFAKGTRDWQTMFNLGADVLGLDPAFDLARARREFPADVAIQGNLDPELLLNLTPAELEVKTGQLLEKLRGRPGHIFNLGHGVPPTTPLENIASVVNTVKKFRGQKKP